MKDFLNYCLYSALAMGIVGALSWLISKWRKRSPKIPALDKRILKILAGGGRAVPALDEDGVVEQVNIYGHPNQDSVDCTAQETLTAYRRLLRLGLIAEDFSTGQKEYAITDQGRLLASSF